MKFWPETLRLVFEILSSIMIKGWKSGPTHKTRPTFSWACQNNDGEADSPMSVRLRSWARFSHIGLAGWLTIKVNKHKNQLKKHWQKELIKMEIWAKKWRVEQPKSTPKQGENDELSGHNPPKKQKKNSLEWEKNTK